MQIPGCEQAAQPLCLLFSYIFRALTSSPELFLLHQISKIFFPSGKPPSDI